MLPDILISLFPPFGFAGLEAAPVSFRRHSNTASSAFAETKSHDVCLRDVVPGDLEKKVFILTHVFSPFGVVQEQMVDDSVVDALLVRSSEAQAFDGLQEFVKFVNVGTAKAEVHLVWFIGPTGEALNCQP